MKIKKPEHLTVKKGIRGGGYTTTVNDILPYLPEESCFFDCRHFVYALTSDVFPFSLTTRINANNQQYLKVMEIKKVIDIKDNYRVMPFNPYKDGTARTIKAQYQQSGMANFKRQDGLGATGVIEALARTICLNSKVDGKQPSVEHRIYDICGIAPVCTTSFHPNLLIPLSSNLKIPQATKQGYVEIEPESVFDAAYPGSSTRRGRVQEGGKVAPTLCTSNELCYFNKDYRIRKLTPRECFRLMGVTEGNIDKIQAAGISNAQQYKMAGNSIVVDVLYNIFRKMFVEKESDNVEMTLF